MANKPLSKVQKKSLLVSLIYVCMLISVAVIANMIVAAQLGVYPQDEPTDHDSPWGCSEIKHKQCTTREGKCTVDKRQCVYPESNDQCEYFMFIDELKKYQKKSLKSSYENITVRQQKRKILQQYCANKERYIYQSVSQDLSVLMLAFEILLSLILLGLFFQQICQIAHKIVYT